MKIWSCFSAVDINNDHQVNSNELRMLLWTYENEQPSNFRHKDSMEIMDKDKSGWISREEWIKYLCLSD